MLLPRQTMPPFDRNKKSAGSANDQRSWRKLSFVHATFQARGRPVYDGRSGCAHLGATLSGSKQGIILKGWKSISPGLRGTSYPGVKQRVPATLKGLNQPPIATANCAHPIPMLLISIAILCATGRCAAMEYLTNEWSLATGAPSETCPAIAPDGTIYFGTFTGRLWAVQPDGSRKWIFRAGLEIKSSPAVGSDGTIYFGSRDRKCYAVRSDGKKKWEFPTGGWVDSSPALADDGAVFFGSWDKTFYALGPDGTKRWKFLTGGPVVSSPAIGANGAIYFGSHDKKFYAFASDGSKKWEYATGG